MTHRPDQVARAIHDACRPHMAFASWCVNAAAVARLVYRELGEQSWPVQVTVIHMNRPYREHVEAGRPESELTPWDEAQPGDPYCTWASAMTPAEARVSPWQLDANRRAGRPGLPGHVLTWVPSWSSYIDPSADQFHRPEHGILLEPCAWRYITKPERPGAFDRDDGGLTAIVPTRLRGFVDSGAWMHRDDDVTRELARLSLALLTNPPNGGREADVSRGY